MIFGSFISGYAVALLVYTLIKTVKKNDEQHGLPEKLSFVDCICFFLCGAASYQGLSITSAILFCVTVYMGFMAYTDKHTRKVYSVASYLVFVPGMCFLIFPVLQTELLVYLLFYSVIVVFGFLIKAYQWGDVEVFIALSPYIMILPVQSLFAIKIDNMYLLLLMFLFSLTVTLIFSVKLFPFRIVKKRPMVPSIAFVYSVMLYVIKFV